MGRQMPSHSLFVRCILSFPLCQRLPSGDPFPIEGAARCGKDWALTHRSTSFTFPIDDDIIIVSGTECCYGNIIKRTKKPLNK